MSGIVKSVKKVFRKVAKSPVMKVLGFALGAAAVVFTAGAALGVGGVLGMGWTGAVSAGVTKVLGTGLLAKVATGAIVQAGIGAAVGMGVAAVTGSNIGEGAAMGAFTGAITGGVSGGMGMYDDAIAQAAGGADQAAQAAAPAANTSGPGVRLANEPTLAGEMAQQPMGQPLSGAQGGGLTPTQAAQRAAQEAGATGTTGAAGATAQAPIPVEAGGATTQAAGQAVQEVAEESGGFVSNVWDKVKDSSMVGHAVSGLGAGLIQSAGGEGDSQMAVQEARQNWISGNYGTGSAGLLTGTQSAGLPNPAHQRPAQRFDPRAYGGRYQYNPRTGQIEFVPAGGGNRDPLGYAHA